jgi:nitrile hydratase subunit beta
VVKAAAASASRFAPGDRVRVAARAAVGHCRTPWYLRGKTGVIAEVHGTFRNPEQLAYHRPGLPAQVLYKVRFEQAEVWGGYAGPAGDHLEADIYEHWLEPL